MLPPIQKKSSMSRDRRLWGDLEKEAPEIGVGARSDPVLARTEGTMVGGMRTADTGPTPNTAALILLEFQKTEQN